MITFKSDSCKKLKFNIGLAGVAAQDLVSKFTLVSENLSLSFPAELIESDIVVEIPALEPAMNLLNEKIDVKLEIVAGDTYLVPWTDTAKIEVPIKVEAVVEEVKDEEKKPIIEVSKLEIKDILSKTKPVKEVIPETSCSKEKKKKSKFAKAISE
jgi:hypothetical protein